MHELSLTVGSVFSGAGLLDIGLHLAGFEHRWMCESDPWRRELLRQRFGVPVRDDIRTLRGQAAADAEREPSELRGGSGAVGSAAGGSGAAPRQQRAGDTAANRDQTVASPVDVIAGGFPCKGASSAGNGTGLEHPETALWGEMRRVVGELRPRYVLIENVRDALSVAAGPGEPAGSLWGVVLADLAALGFDVRWDCVPAAAVGAPHLRDRIFAVATNTARVGAGEPSDAAHAIAGGWDTRVEPAGRDGVPAPNANGTGGQGHRCAERVRAQVSGADGVHDRATAADTRGGRRQGEGWRGTLESDECSAGADDQGRSVAVEWGEYEPAIQRWEALHGAAPEPLVRRLDDGDPKLSRVRARVDRSRLSALGDGVHVYCGWVAGEYVMGLERERLGLA